MTTTAVPEITESTTTLPTAMAAKARMRCAGCSHYAKADAGDPASRAGVWVIVMRTVSADGRASRMVRSYDPACALAVGITDGAHS